MTVLELDVGPVAHGGICVARHEGRVVFVRHALPGERVRARITEERSRYARADAVEVLTPSADRVEPPCPYAGPGRCGGCDWQHAALPAQRQLKAAVVAEQLRRLARYDVDVVVEELPGAPEGLGWRTRVRFAVAEDGRLGLYRHRSHEVEPVDRCLIAHPLVEQVGAERRPWPGARAVEVVAAVGTGETATVATPADAAGDVTGDGSDGVVHERAGGRTWQVHGAGFWQVHPAAADTLLAAVQTFGAVRPGERVIDLYAGAGLFAGGLAEAVGPDGSVLAVEWDRAAAADARHNLADLPQAQVLRARVSPPVLRRSGPVDVVVLDPPRTGAGGAVVDAVARLAPRAVVYVACDPASLARDVAAFDEHGYDLRGLRAFDLFPMTAHVECVALLEPAAGG